MNSVRRMDTFVLLIFAAVAGCGGKGRIEVPALDPSGAGAQAIAQFDANRDGAIAGPEFASAPGLKAGLRHVDRDKNGQVTADEIAARLSQYQSDQLGLIQLYAQATLDGRPLDGAIVTLVPEKFMGPAIKPAHGTTDSKGLCMFQTEAEEVAGVRCGMFRIEVSKKDAAGHETLPAKYNSQSQLGEEVGRGSPVVNQGLTLNLTTR